MAFGFTTDENNVFGQSVQESGTYNVKILDSSEAKTSSTGSEMAVFDYEVVDGEYQGGKVRYDNMVWKDGTAEEAERSTKNFNNMAIAAGAKSGVQFSSLAQYVKSMIGKTINVKVEWQTSDYTGKTNLTVRAKTHVDSDGSKPDGITRDMFEAKNSGPQKQAPTSNAFANKQPEQTGFNPFAKQAANNGEINISDDDLPF
ncbi:DUF669 domain-containing protein [Fructobacillus tropaeoli]|uniref:DUF669 domain-containing protein n=1 Tax=Fructobacillus tropaeoli TaxID=709323 RepID=A0A3F3H223_9LACO|nr:DUF669 domain-containing protein [Fructobacillus tropaeoli]GAP05031.1 hypothetical protein FTRO_0240060 [Fructobacillus tropaeoli]